LDFEIGFFEGILRKRPDFCQALTALGEAYTCKGLYRKGLEADLRLLALTPLDEFVYYNCACDYSLLKDADNSLRSLEKAIVLGYRDYRYMEKDPDLAFARDDPRFSKLVAKYRKRRARKDPPPREININ
jgi:tetratricopeptide (TPR) repeat protein